MEKNTCRGMRYSIMVIGLLTPIQSGSYGFVYGCDDLAVKLFPDDDDFEEELAVALKMRGEPYVVQYVSDAQLPQGRAIFYDRADSDASKELMAKDNPALLRQFITFVVESVEWMRANSLVHRDLKPCNVLYYEQGQRFRLGDIGSMCSTVPDGGLPLPTGLVRTTFVPPALEGDLSYSLGNLFHTASNAVEEAQWIDLYCALSMISWAVYPMVPDMTQDHVDELQDAVLGSESDYVVAALDAGLQAGTYAECAAVWRHVVNGIRL